MKPIVKVECLSKQYLLGAIQGRHPIPRSGFTNNLRARISGLRRARRAPGETLWALKDVSFQVEPGEVVGIIGRNGAGKSTLLKILSRITEPTSGRIELYGRVGSLLEVGTGFHPELTGRENIFLNAAILGMRRRDIETKYDEIVAFAEIEKFMDTPVKRYSSGMYVRLAFAVAAYLEPEILIVDEVLAVGDTAFQKRCLGRMQDVTKRGRTVLFVSHNMLAVKTLCDRAILLEAGRITREGPVDQVVDAYLTSGDETSTTGEIPTDALRSGTGEAQVRRVELLDAEDNPISQVYFGQTLRLALTLEVTKKIEDALIGLGISSLDGIRVTSSYSLDGGRPPVELFPGWYRVLVELDLTLLPRHYALDVAVCYSGGADIDVVNSALKFEALGLAQAGDDHYRWETVHGFIRVEGRWQITDGADQLPASNAAA